MAFVHHVVLRIRAIRPMDPDAKNLPECPPGASPGSKPVAREEKLSRCSSLIYSFTLGLAH
uniref:Uncharacterized protein n=1 Tax=Anguilla anguilla TaxID=7936 RepID=A0A0E9T572_ANGAN